MLVGRDGRIQCATPLACRYLGEHFGLKRGANELPPDLSEWLKKTQRAHARSRPFTAESTSGQLVISLLHREADKSFCLLLQGRTVGVALPRGRHLGLTKRQAEVHALLKRGKRNSEIAKALGVGAATAKRHVEDVLARLHVPNRAAAAGIQ